MQGTPGCPFTSVHVVNGGPSKTIIGGERSNTVLKGPPHIYFSLQGNLLHSFLTFSVGKIYTTCPRDGILFTSCDKHCSTINILIVTSIAEPHWRRKNPNLERGSYKTFLKGGNQDRGNLPSRDSLLCSAFVRVTVLLILIFIFVLLHHDHKV